MSMPSIVEQQYYCGLALAFCGIIFALLKCWNELRYRSKGIPPGTMGWPIFGETAGFLNKGPDFIRGQKARYGNMFKTHTLGSPTVISIDPEINKYILLNEAKGLIPGYPMSMRTILGDTNIAAVHGAMHKRIRGNLLTLVGSSAIRGLVSKTDKFMRPFLDGWAAKVIDIQEKTKQMAFVVSMNHIVDDEPNSFHEAFKAIFDNIFLGTISVPINLPGTNYFRGLQSREKVKAILKELFAKRRASSAPHDDLLDRILKDEDSKHKLINDEEIIDQIIAILNSGYETVSTTTMMTVKYLYDHPRVLQELRDEHFAILERKRPEDLVSWEDYKNMTFTKAVIFETSRLASVVNGLLRKTVADVVLNGFTIPKGWKIYVYTREINFDPVIYPEPFTFNPWRWLENGLESHKYQMLFGAGARLCPGKEWGILKISMFLHHFVTKYRWEEVEGTKLVKFPRVAAPNGLKIRVDDY